MVRRSRSTFVRDTTEVLASAIRDARLAYGWSQQVLAQRARTSQPVISRLEHRAVTLLDLEVVARILHVLGIHGRLVLQAPILSRSAPQLDAGHARCVGYVARCLRRAGFLVATEVDVGDGRWHGWIDVLAYDPGTGMVVVIEVKTELHDIGAEQRRFASYERECYAAARRLGWAPRFRVGALAVLRTTATEGRIRENAELLTSAFPGDASTFAGWLTRPPDAPSNGRALIAIDPRGRGPRWALDARPDRRRRPPRYVDYADFVRGGRRPAPG